MASGNRVIEIIKVLPPGTLFATPDIRVGGSTPTEQVPVWDFDASTQEYLDFLCRLSENYASGGLTLKLPFMMTSATTGAVVWSAAIRRIAADAEDIDVSQTYDFNDSSATTVASAAGEVVEATITFTNGADMDSWATTEYAIVRVSRKAADAGDTATGDAELLTLIGKET